MANLRKVNPGVVAAVAVVVLLGWLVVSNLGSVSSGDLAGEAVGTIPGGFSISPLTSTPVHLDLSRGLGAQVTATNTWDVKASKNTYYPSATSSVIYNVFLEPNAGVQLSQNYLSKTFRYVTIGDCASLSYADGTRHLSSQTQIYCYKKGNEYGKLSGSTYTATSSFSTLTRYGLLMYYTFPGTY